MKTAFLFLLTLIYCCTLFGQNEKGSNIESIELGYSFGECGGYCKAQLVVQPSWQILALTSWSTKDTARLFENELSSTAWQDFYSPFDTKRFVEWMISMDAQTALTEGLNGLV